MPTYDDDFEIPEITDFTGWEVGRYARKPGEGLDIRVIGAARWYGGWYRMAPHLIARVPAQEPADGRLSSRDGSAIAATATPPGPAFPAPGSPR